MAVETHRRPAPPATSGSRSSASRTRGCSPGKARFIDDLSLPGMLHAAFVRSPHAHARVDGDRHLARARARRRHRASSPARTSDQLGPLVATGAMRDEVVDRHRGRRSPPRRSRHVGDPVAVVVATIAVPRRGRPRPRRRRVGAAAGRRRPGARARAGRAAARRDARAPTTSRTSSSRPATSTAAFAEADHVFTKRFVVGRSTAAPLEGRGVIAEYDERGGGHMTIYASSQMPHLHAHVPRADARDAGGARHRQGAGRRRRLRPEVHDLPRGRR